MNKVIWLTGLPSSGKTTIAESLVKSLDAIHLDGDLIRNSYISKGLKFSKKDRDINQFRVAEIAKLCVQKSHVVCSFVSPYNSTRAKIKEIIGDSFIEVFVNCSLDECMRRDPKGLYMRALDGLIDNFTGISDTYEAPETPDIEINTEIHSVKRCCAKILNFIGANKVYSLYIGRWNGVFHNGHAYIVQQKLKESKNVLLAIRDIRPDKNNPWSASKTKEMLEYYYQDEARVKVIIIPDIDSVNYGRGVGYDITEIQVDKKIAGISGTECRKILQFGEINSLKKYVPVRIIEFLVQDL